MKKTESEGFNFVLPFDPFRLLLAVLERLGLILLVGLVCGGLGLAYAVVRMGTTYSVSLELVTDTWHGGGGEEGTAYVPAPLNSEAVLIASKAEEVFESTGASLDSEMSGKAVRQLVELKQLPGEGLFSVDARTGEGREVTLEVAKAYAAALMQHTAQLRRDEARAQYQLLEKQLENKVEVAKEIDKEIISYAEQEGVHDPLGKTGAMLLEFTQLKELLAEAERELATNDDLVLGYIRKELVAGLRLQLADLLATKSDGHSLVLGKKQEIREIEQQIEASSKGGAIDLQDFDELLPTNVYLAAQRLEEERKGLENKVADYRGRLAKLESAMGGLPERSLALTEMSKIRDQAVASSVALRGMMNDAEFFATEAPPALSVFHTPTLAEVGHRPLLIKAVVLTVFGFCAGAGLVVGGALLFEMMGRRVRTPMQAAIAAGAYPKLVFPPSRKTTKEIALRNFWVRCVARFLPGERRMIFPVIGELPDEAGFWTRLFDSLEDEGQRVVFVDFSTDDLELDLPKYDGADPARVSRIDSSEYPVSEFGRMLASFPEGHVLLIRWDMSATSTLVELAPHIDRQYLLTSQEVPLSAVEEESRGFRDIFGAADGLVLVNSRQPARSQMIVNRLQDWYLESYRRNALRSSPNPL